MSKVDGILNKYYKEEEERKTPEETLLEAIDVIEEPSEDHYLPKKEPSAEDMLELAKKSRQSRQAVEDGFIAKLKELNIDVDAYIKSSGEGIAITFKHGEGGDGVDIAITGIPEHGMIEALAPPALMAALHTMRLIKSQEDMQEK